MLILLGGRRREPRGWLADRRHDRRQDGRVSTPAPRGGPGPLRARALSGVPAIKTLAPFDHQSECVGFLAYQGKPNRFTKAGAQCHVLTRVEQDAVAALRALADELGAPPAEIPSNGPRPVIVNGKPSPENLASTIAALLPDHAVVVDESVSYGRGFFKNAHAAAPHDWIQNMGGAIGAGVPLATGAAVGLRSMKTDRRVVALQADGSAMYTAGLVDQAREAAPVTTVLLSNRKYQILIGEFFAVGANPGRTAMDMLDLGNPDIGWVQLAEGMGVEAASTDTLDGVADLMTQSFRRPGPFLIELAI